MKRNGSQSTLDSFFGLPKRVATESISGDSESTSDMASNEPIRPGTSTGGGECKYRGIRGVRQSNPEDHTSMVQELSEMADNFVRRLVEKSWEPTCRFFSDVLVYRDDRERADLEQLLTNAGSNYRRSLFWFVTDVDDNHIHVHHDCNFSNRSCRCAWRSEILAKFPGSCKQAIGKRRHIGQLSIDDWIDVVIYYSLLKWGKPSKIWFNGKSQRLPSASESLRWDEIKRTATEILARNDRCLPSHLFQEGQGNSSNGSNVARSGWVNVRPKATKFDTIFEKVQALLEKYPTSPIRAIRKHEEFRQDRMLINLLNENDVKSAIEDFGHRINNFSLRDFEEFYQKEGCEPVFKRSAEYMSIEESLSIVDDLLKFQFNDDDEAITEFLTTCVTVFEKKVPKLNTVIIHSKASSGKNFFVDMILSIALNYGEYSTANKHFPFAYMDGVDKRAILWDEPDYSSDQIETLKKLLGGFTESVNVKNRGYHSTDRTPHYIATNNVISVMYLEEFKDRVKVYEWRPCLFLKEKDLLPNPLSLYPLLNKYNIKYYKMPFVGYKPANVQAFVLLGA